jgi:O-methyltransferase
LLEDIPKVSLGDKMRILKQLYVISVNVESPHTQDEMLRFIRAILTLPSGTRGSVVEAGCYKGSSTAKFSLAADIAGRTLVVFDSFEGIPENDESHEKNIFGGPAFFRKGDYRGTLEEVKTNVARFGKLDRCRFVKGWFDDTMPDFREPIAAVYIDVDLASSTRCCLKHLYPLLEDGCALYSQDGHLPLVLRVFNDDEFWSKEVGFAKPSIQGFGKSKLIRVAKGAREALVQAAGIK